MRDSRIRVVQDLVVRAVTHQDDTVVVDVNDRSGSARQITFHPTGPDHAADLTGQIEHWWLTGTYVTYVSYDGEGALLDEREVFARALGDDFDERFV